VRSIEGEYEDRLKAVLKEIESAQVRSFCLSMSCTRSSAPAAEGAIDASNMLKPALARGGLRCGRNDAQRIQKYIEKDAALERRFRQIMSASQRSGHNRYFAG
jgi:ATP-dependent Clp protease ATP-binding subunit ClpB